MSKQGGKAKPLKAPKADKKEYDESDLAYLQKKKDEEKGHARRELRCGEADKKEIAGLKLQIEALNEKIRACELKNKQHEELLEKKYEHEKKRRQNLQKQLSESQKQLSELQLEFQAVCVKLARALP